MPATCNDGLWRIPLDVREIVYDIMYNDLVQDGNMAPVAAASHGSSYNFRTRINSIPAEWDGATRTCRQLRDELRAAYFRHRVCRFSSQEVVRRLSTENRHRARRGELSAGKKARFYKAQGHRKMSYGAHLAFRARYDNHFELRLPTRHICGLLRNVEIRLSPPGITSLLSHGPNESWFDQNTFRYHGLGNDWLLPLRALHAVGFTWLRELTIRVPIQLFETNDNARPLTSDNAIRIATALINEIEPPAASVKILWEEFAAHDRIKDFL